MRLVIAIDGGGIRGVLPLILLKEIQNRLSTNLYDFNPHWWGTSTGSIIASSLAIQGGQPFSISVQQVLDLYEFRSNTLIRPKSPNNRERGISQLIRTNFGGIKHADFPELNIVASHYDGHEPFVFQADFGEDLGDVVLASCAFPGLFPPVEIKNKLYVDGFYRAKNPARLAFDSFSNDINEPVVLLSLGTGVMRQVDRIEEEVQATDLYLQEKTKERGFHYYRFNPTLINGADDMQNVAPKNIFNLRKDALIFLDENTELLDSLIKVLAD